MLVDAGIFFDEQIARRNVGFRLIVIVVGHEIFHRIFRQKFAHLGIQLRGEGFVRREYQRRPADARDHMRHRVGFAGAGDAEQGLKCETVVDALD